MLFAFKNFDGFKLFVIERHRIWRRRESGSPQPWTKNPILRDYKFTNVYREFDRVTKWIAANWRDPHDTHKDLWFAMVVARLINKPESLALLSLPGRWNKAQFLDTLNARKKSGETVFSAAYIVSTGGKTMDKLEYLADFVLDPMWEKRQFLRPQVHDTLRGFFNRLSQFDGMGSFMAAQVVADMKYSSQLNQAKDWWTFAASGPGSRKGMNYVLGRDRKGSWREHEWKEALMELAELMGPVIEEEQMPRIHNQDLQNCLCEYSKFRRTELGEGRPKQKFTPYQETSDESV